MQNEVILFDDVAFMVTSLIDRAPNWTMVRELTKNALESAEKARGDKIVHWTTGQYEGVTKAVIWNTGPGMNEEELKRATNLACKIDKNLSLDENFGIGAKVSSLPSNKHGMRYRSCKEGVVHEVILGFDEDKSQYVRFQRQIGERLQTVVDVTELVRLEGRYSLGEDWTEVMLLGNEADQDTSVRPFSLKPTNKSYVADSLYRRFYRIPEGVKVRLDAVYHRFDTTRNFVPMASRYQQFERCETVQCPGHGFRIHFLHDPRVGDASGLTKSSRGSLGSSTTTCCFVHKDEMFSVLTGHPWSALAPQFGVAFGAKELCVHIELDDDEARPSQYRERLISPQTGDDLLIENYADYVRSFMPEWVKEIVRKASPQKKEDYSDLQRSLQEMLDRYRVPVVGQKFASAGGDPVEKADDGTPVGGGADRVSPPPLPEPEPQPAPEPEPCPEPMPRPRPQRDRFRKVPEGVRATKSHEMYEKAPEIIMLVDEQHIVDNDLQGKAGKEFVNAGKLFVNGHYEAVYRTVDDLLPELASLGDREVVHAELVDAARNAMAYRIGKATVFALAKRANQHWTDEDLKAALSPQSLSIAADDYIEDFAAVRRYVRERIKVRRAEMA